MLVNTKELYNNRLEITGVALSEPTFTHTVHTPSEDVHYYRFMLSSERFSGASDDVEISVKEELMKDIDFTKPIRIIAEVRTANIGASLKIYVFATEMSNWTGTCNINEFNATVYTCKAPKHRITPRGRKITDLICACIRTYKNRSDYFPMVVWGTKAEEARDFKVGQKLYIKGRLQSRKYNKVIENETVEKTAFEVSVADFEVLD